MKKVEHLFLILFFSVFMFSSCKKQTDTFGPQITITKPLENQQLNMFDEIQVTANICDDHKLTTIDVSVIDESFVTVITSPTIYPENNCYELTRNIPITDIYLPSGYYYLLIHASDGINETKKFQKIYITTLPKKLKYLIVVSKNAGQINISKIDSANTLTLLKTLTSDYCGSVVSSDAQQFYVAGHYTGDIQVFSTIDWELQWNIPCIVSPPFPYFEAIDVHNKMLYVSYRSGKFEVYNSNGSIKAQRVIEDGNFATRFMPVGTNLITYERSPSPMVKNLVVYYTPSYTIRQKFILNYEIQSIQNLNNKKALLFCNHVNYITYKVVDIAGQTLSDISTEYHYPINSVAHIEATDYSYIAADGVFVYSYPGLSSYPFNSGSHIDNLVYDETNNNYYFSENFHTVKKFVFPYSIVQSSVNVPDTIINLLPVYNKD